MSKHDEIANGAIIATIRLGKPKRRQPTPSEIYRRHPSPHSSHRHDVMDRLMQAEGEVGRLPHCDEAKRLYEKATGDRWHLMLKHDGDIDAWVDRLVSWTIKQYGRMPSTGLH